MIAAVCLLAFGLGIQYASSAEISRSVPGRITINFLTIQASADIDGNGVVDHRGLMVMAAKLNTYPAGKSREDINHDGLIDVLDLAIVAQYFGQRVEI